MEQNTGMAGVVPAWKIIEVLNSEELMEIRKKGDEPFKQERSKSGVSLHVADSPQPTQVTEKGIAIPVPTEEQISDALTKASRKLK